MRKAVVIIVVLPFLFVGSTGQNQRSDRTDMDTNMAERIASRLAYQWAEEQAKVIDSVFAKEIIGRVDVEPRPDGSIYQWAWHYRVSGEDTVFLKTVIKKVR